MKKHGWRSRVADFLFGRNPLVEERCTHCPKCGVPEGVHMLQVATGVDPRSKKDKDWWEKVSI